MRKTKIKITSAKPLLSLQDLFTANVALFKRDPIIYSVGFVL